MLDTTAADNAALANKTMQPLRQGVARAALASGVTEAATRVLTIILSIATARALLPSQVGILGLAVIVVGIVSLVAACSETAGIVGRYKGTDSQHAFAATVVRGLIVTILVLGLYLSLPVVTGVLASAEDTQPELIGLLHILIWLPVVELAANYPRVLLQRRLDLTYLAGVGLFQASFQVGLSVILLWKGYGAVGVIWSSIIAAALSTAAAWLRISGSRWPEWAGLPDAKQRLAVLMNTSKIFVGSFLGYLNGRADNLLVAGAIGPTAMGFYGMAWSASRVAPQILGQAFGFVLVPALAQIQSDQKRVERALRESLRHSYLLLAPLAAGLFVLAPSLVAFVLGAKWLPMVSCLRVMCVAVLAGPVIAASNAQLVSSGRAYMTGLATAAQLGVLAVAIFPLSRRWGLLGAAFGDLIAVSVLTMVLLSLTPVLRRMLRHIVLSSVFVPLAAALVSGFTSWTFTQKLASGSPKLLVQASILLVSYPLILSLVGGRAAIREFLNLLRNVKQRVPATLSSS